MLCYFNKIKILEILSKEVNIKNTRKESKIGKYYRAYLDIE
ncbi:hypothetical protein ACH36K_13810 [Clostridium sp. MB05]|nr:hypothetical protein [Clostridium perfringens]